MLSFTCSHCDKAYTRTKNQVAKPAKYRYCSRTCQNRAQSRRFAPIRTERCIAARAVDKQPSTYRVIRLKNGQIVKLDIGDFDLGSFRPWHIHSGGYASCKPYYLHRLVLERMIGRPLLRSEVADHKNHDKLDNRRANLRIATVALNGGNMKLPAHNTSGFKGVQYKPNGCKSRPWLASLKYNQREVFLGFFADAEDAAYCYDQFAVALWGEFALTNVL